jgi:hypothetical protein
MATRLRLVPLAALALTLSGCYGDTGIGLTIHPNHGSMFGQFDVTIFGDLASLGDVNYFSVAGVQVVNPRWTPTSVTVTLQGAPAPGPYDIVIQGNRGRTIQHGIFTYDAAHDPAVPLTWIAFGASMTLGTESLGINLHTQVYGVTAQIARAAGVYIGLPLFNPQTTPPLTPGDFYPDCTRIPGTGAGANTIEATTSDPITGTIDLRRARLDWTLKPRDVAVGGATVSDVLNGVGGGKALLAHIVNDPEIDPAEILSPEQISQLERVERLDPNIGLSTDLMANDLDAAVSNKDDLRPDLITPIEMVKPMLQQIMARLGKLHGHYFIANFPSLTFVPNVAALRARRLADGSDSAASFDAKVHAIDTATAGYNAALVAAMAPYPNLHLVDFGAYVAGVHDGVRIGGEWLTLDAWGGLLSLDGLHLTDTAYALYAQKFIDRINEVLGLHIPAPDATAVHAQDPLAPHRLRDAGYSCVPPAL